jgi:pyruvate,water dikinase
MSLDVLDPRSARAGERSLAHTLVPSRPASRLLAVGLGVGAKTVTGRARYVARPQDLDGLRPGEIVMAEETTPAWDAGLARAGGIVVNRGDESCHAAQAARRLGVPAVVAAHDGASPLWTGAVIALVAGEDGSGRIFQELTRPNGTGPARG